jgi:RsiW-degrading membrane proteinase PrsW (M82 family)
MGLLLSFFFGYIPAFINAGIIYWLDRYEKEPKTLLLGVFFWGAIVASGAAFIINTLLGVGVYIFTSSESATDLTTGSLIAPVIEESLKGIAVLIVFWAARHEFDSILDGIIYAAITALGFSATENMYYIYEYGYVKDGIAGLFVLAFIRVILVGWQHPFYTAFIGIGLATARLSRSTAVKFLAVVGGYCVAVVLHSIHNTLAFYSEGIEGLATTTLVDWTGWLAMVVFIIIQMRREKNLIVQYLADEVAYGTISAQQYSTACSPGYQWKVRMFAIGGRRYRLTTRFYRLCGEIAHKKRQYVRLGDEKGNGAIIESLRAELRELSQWAPAMTINS